MEFFNNMGKKINNMTDISKLKSQIISEEKRINSYFENLGKAYYELKKDNCDTALEEIVNLIKESYTKIEKLEEEIKELENIKTCPNCGTVLQDDMIYCIGCGRKIVREEPKKEVEEDVKFCIACGTKIPKISVYCIKCGTKQE